MDVFYVVVPIVTLFIGFFLNIIKDQLDSRLHLKKDIRKEKIELFEKINEIRKIYFALNLDDVKAVENELEKFSVCYLNIYSLVYYFELYYPKESLSRGNFEELNIISEEFESGQLMTELITLFSNDRSKYNMIINYHWDRLLDILKDMSSIIINE